MFDGCGGFAPGIGRDFEVEMGFYTVFGMCFVVLCVCGWIMMWEDVWLMLNVCFGCFFIDLRLFDGLCGWEGVMLRQMFDVVWMCCDRLFVCCCVGLDWILLVYFFELLCVCVGRAVCV